MRAATLPFVSGEAIAVAYRADAPPGALAPSEEALRDYRSVSVLAVIAFVAALASPLAWIHPLLAILPWVSIALGAWALWRLRSHAELSGGGLAKAAVAIALVSAIGPPVRDQVYMLLVKGEARDFGAEWFAHLAADQPQLAHQLTYDPWSRVPPGSDVWAWYRENQDEGRALGAYVNEPLIRSLLGLGRHAAVRFDDTLFAGTDDDTDSVLNSWTVTYDDADGQRKTFYVILTLQRQFDPVIGRGRWKILKAHVRTRFDVDPKSIRSDADSSSAG